MLSSPCPSTHPRTRSPHRTPTSHLTSSHTPTKPPCLSAHHPRAPQNKEAAAKARVANEAAALRDRLLLRLEDTEPKEGVRLVLSRHAEPDVVPYVVGALCARVVWCSVCFCVLGGRGGRRETS